MMSLSIRMAGPSLRTEDLFNLDHLHRLYLCIIQRMRLELHAMEIDLHKVNATDCAVPRRSVIKSHGILVCHSCELCCAWKTLWNILCSVLDSDRKIEIIEKVESLHHCVEAGRLSWRCSLEERGTYKS